MKHFIGGCLTVILAAGAAHAQVTPNDTCAGAFPLTCGSHVIETNTALAFNDYDQLGVCTGFASGGPDIVYEILIPEGGMIDFTLDTSLSEGSSYDGSLYLITDCDDPAGSCLVGSDECDAFDNVQQIIYTNTTGAIQTTLLIVDGFGADPSLCGASSGTGVLTGTIFCPVQVETAIWGRVKSVYASD